MFVNPSPFIRTPINPNSVQPNAIDCYVTQFFALDDDRYNSYFEISENGRDDRNRTEVITSKRDGIYGDWFMLNRGVFAFETSYYCEIPEGYCGWLITRSSLNRNGIIVHSGLYDSGYRGYIGGVLYNLAGRACIAKDTRICQFLVAKADTLHLYNGQYNQEIK